MNEELERPGDRRTHLARPALDGRKPLHTRGEVIAFRCSLRLASIPALSHRLSGAVLDEIRNIVAAEVDVALGLRQADADSGKRIHR
jgi:hypothetical protein